MLSLYRYIGGYVWLRDERVFKEVLFFELVFDFGVSGWDICYKVNVILDGFRRY